MDNYEEQSDFEINKAVCKALGKKFKKKYQEEVGIFANHVFVDYCNNPADAWPIIVENKISIEYESKVMTEWSAFGGNFDGIGYDVESSHANPLRAAMIVFLKMQEQG